MSNKNVRVTTKPNEFSGKYVKVKLEQDFDILEVLSLSVTQEDVYRRFCSDYGVVVGRVIMNNGVGVPNAKVSIFVPLDGEESEEVANKYPYSNINDKDIDGKRYNLLPKQRQIGCHSPVGTLADKSEILDNDDMLDIHCKYYKYSAITNHAGDFMIFGVPVGTHFINTDVDLSDIGIYSQRPYDFIREGQPVKAFDGVTKFKSSEDIDKLIQIKSSQTSVNVGPFWGDEEDCEVGITRIDFDTKHNIQPSAIFMGSIFSDNEKNSINKQCRPRRKLGSLCETVGGSGSIEMIRKTLDGQTERFDVEGGRVITEEGAWAYQIPMNLDYMITDEFGDLVPSDDPSRGIPTRTRVRFKAGMDSTGDEGRLRHRAKYLIPHNPNNYSESDYSFDESTKDIHFRDMSWNQIYSIKNFIPRYQKSQRIDIRAFTGIKNVDNCTGTHNPFPFNRMDSDINPLFSVLCIIITIIATLVIMLNTVILTILNTVLVVINSILIVLNNVLFTVGKLVCALRHLSSSSKRTTCRKDLCLSLNGNCQSSCKTCKIEAPINYIPCVTLDCGGETYGPGCLDKGGNGFPFTHTNNLDNYPGDGDPAHEFENTRPPGDGGWTACVTVSIADALNVWELDFYNDWINGSLYAFLLKYKKKKRGKEKFCEYDCKDFGGGVDGNQDGVGDNRCKRNHLVDSCTNDSVRKGETALINEGLIKNYKGELYYAAYTHETDYKLFATDIINLGAIFECDWLGNPKIQPSLIPTSYKLSPLLDENDDDNKDVIVVSGLNSPRAKINHSLFFNLNCLGLFTDSRTCLNIKRQCEIGVGLNEDRTDEGPSIGCTATGGGSGNVYSPHSNDRPTLDNCDIDDLFIRDALVMLNKPTLGIDLTSTGTNGHSIFDSWIYNSYRGYSKNEVSQPRGDSFYFYFGLVPGKTGLDLMNRKYFEECIIPTKDDFLITGVVTDVTDYGGSDGSIDITVVGGVGPYTYIWTDDLGTTTEDISGLSAGTYTVTVVDSEGSQATGTFTVGQPFPVTCFSNPKPVSKSTLSDGEIEVMGVGGGIGPYTVKLIGPSPSTTTQTQIIMPPNSSTVFTNLAVGTYSTVVEDSSPTMITCGQDDIEITSPPPLTINVVKEDIECFGFENGSINLNYITGVPPVSYITTGPNGYSNTNSIQNGLNYGTYTIVATDNIGQTNTQIVNIYEPTEILINYNVENITCNGTQDGEITITPSGGVGPYTYKWEDPNGSQMLNTGPTITNIGSPSRPVGIYTVEITDSTGCIAYFDIEVKQPPVISISATATDIPPNGSSTDGEITANGSGGNPAMSPANGVYTYTLTGPMGQTITTTTSSTTVTFNNLIAGTYTVTIKDVNNCTSTTTVTISQL